MRLVLLGQSDMPVNSLGRSLYTLIVSVGISRVIIGLGLALRSDKNTPLIIRILKVDRDDVVDVGEGDADDGEGDLLA